jgi:GAF domain-containing protein
MKQVRKKSVPVAAQGRRKRAAGQQAETIRQLTAEVERLRRELQALSDLSSTVVSDRYLGEILQLIVTVTAEMMGTSICSVMLLDEERQELVIKATQSLSEEYRSKAPVKVGQSISGQAVRERRAISVRDVTAEPSYAYPDIARRAGIVSMLAVPMFFKDKVIGVVNVYTSQVHEFSDHEVSVLQAIANQSAAAIENSRLMDELRQSRELLETRKSVDRAKGILMRHKRLNEEEAYRLIQKKSMDTGRPMKDIAQAIILAFEND